MAKTTNYNLNMTSSSTRTSKFIDWQQTIDGDTTTSNMYLIDQALATKLNTSGNSSNTTAAFTEAGTRTNIATGETLATLFGKIKKWFTDLGTAAFKAAGSASGNVPVNGAALGTTANVPVVTDASGNIIPHASGVIGTAAFKSAGNASGNVPLNGSALGTTANVPVVTNASGALIPHASGVLGTAAFKAAGSTSGGVPINGSALGTTANVPVVTDSSGNIIPHASGALGSSAFKTAGSANGNVPLNGAALGTTLNVPIVTNASGALIPHASGALGTAAFKAAPSSTTATLAVASWSSLSQTVTVTGVTASNIVIISPDPASLDAYSSAKIRCTTQAANSLTFACTTTPTVALTVNVVIM